MREWVRRIRGAIGMGLTWAVDEVAEIGLTPEEMRALLG